MLSFLTRGFRRSARFESPKPDEPLCVIGDVHGSLDPLEELLARVPTGYRVVLVGDYIDRGENSADVLRLLAARPDYVCLMGNHEQMLLRFLADPTGPAARWIHHGGLQTLASFGVRGVGLERNSADLIDCRDKLLEAMGERMLAWLADLPSHYLSGNVLVAHAGADPACPPDGQTDELLIWGHPRFQSKDRRDGYWVVHGHTIVSEAHALRGRIAIDTGAYATGVLSAVCLDGSTPKFL